MGEAKRRKLNDPSWGQGKSKHTNDRAFRVKIIENDENDQTYLLEDQKLKHFHNAGNAYNPREHAEQALSKLENGELLVSAYLWVKSPNITLQENQYYVVELSHHPNKSYKYGIPTVERIIDTL